MQRVAKTSLVGFVLGTIVTAFVIGGLMRELWLYTVVQAHVGDDQFPWHFFVAFFQVITTGAAWRVRTLGFGVNKDWQSVHTTFASFNVLMCWILYVFELFAYGHRLSHYPHSRYEGVVSDLAYQSRFVNLFLLFVSAMCSIWWVYTAFAYDDLAPIQTIAKDISDEEKKE